MWVNTNKEKDTQPDISFSVSDKIEKKNDWTNQSKLLQG
jgi:hypothetical protein